MSMIRDNFIELEGSMQEVMDHFVKRKEDLTKKFFDISKSTRAQENHIGMNADGLMTEWGGQVSYSDIEKGHKNEYRHVKYSNGRQIERELLDDEEFREVKTRAKSLSYGVIKTLNWHAVRPFEDGFSTFLAANGLSFFNDAHYLRADNSDDSQDNKGVLALNIDNFETVCKTMTQYKDDQGHPMMIQPRMVIAGEYQRKTLKQMFGSEKEAFTSDNQINAYDDFTYFCTPWITGKKWITVDPEVMMGGTGLNWYMRRDPRKVEYTDDFDTEKGKYKVVGRWSYGVDMPLFANGQDPA